MREVADDVYDSSLFWSPDGQTVGFRSYSGIWLITQGEEESTFLVRGYDAAWSPDGQRVAVVVDNGGGGWPLELHIFDPISGESEEVFDNVVLGGLAGHIAWSPDGRHIAFYAYSLGQHQTEPREYEYLSSLDLETREVRHLVEFRQPGSPDILGWTADGEWIVVGGSRNWFVHRDRACAVRPPELDPTQWYAFDGQSARLLVIHANGYRYLVDLREALGPDFPDGVLACP